MSRGTYCPAKQVAGRLAAGCTPYIEGIPEVITQADANQQNLLPPRRLQK